MPLHHYIIVRRDLPLGVLAAAIAHAAGESFYLFPSSSVLEHTDSSREGAGSTPASGSTFNPAETVAIVLGARNEGRLSSLLTMLLKAGIRYVPVVETEGPYAQQLLAVGLVPDEKHRLLPFINHFHMLPENLYSEGADGVLAMTVARLGGTVEGHPTHRGNFLQRIDALVALEKRRR